MRIDSKVRKKPQTDRVRMHFLSGSVHFSGSAKFQKMARDLKFKFAVTGKIISFPDRWPLTTASETTINMTVRVYISGL